MSTRRQFLKQSAGVLAATSLQIACTPQDKAASKPSPWLSKVPRIKSVKRREDTILRLGGQGDNFPMTWAADDRQLVTVDDGWGWIQHPRNLYNNRLFALIG
jgi:hypothetical protein